MNDWSGKLATGNVTGLRITLDARDPIWELPPVKGGSPVALIGWAHGSDSRGCGVPPLTRGIIAGALTRHCRLTFPYPSVRPGDSAGEWQHTPDGWLRVLQPVRLAGLRGDSPIPLLSTTLPEMAARLFDAHPFSWVLKSQAAILSDRNAPAPNTNLSYQTLAKLLAREPLDERTLIAESQARLWTGTSRH
jgi:hypothetical protein